MPRIEHCVWDGLKKKDNGIFHEGSGHGIIKQPYMEYSIWQKNLSSKVNPKALHITPKNNHMEYSMWHEIVTMGSLFHATCSTPFDKFGVNILSSKERTVVFVLTNPIEVPRWWRRKEE